MTTSFPVSAGFFVSAGPSAASCLFARVLMPIILDMTRLFYIGKLITNADNTTTDNTTAMKITKSTI